jgi:hypothetical protein
MLLYRTTEGARGEGKAVNKMEHDGRGTFLGYG